MAAPPDWLSATWERSYIRRRAEGAEGLGEPDASVLVRYIQTSANGHAFDLRIKDGLRIPGLEGVRSAAGLSEAQLQALTAPGAVECFAGVTTAATDGDGKSTLSWHAGGRKSSFDK